MSVLSSRLFAALPTLPCLLHAHRRAPCLSTSLAAAGVCGGDP
jgi:hypothetical protein